MEPQFSIRKATLADESGVIACLQIAFDPYKHFYSEEGFRDSTLTPASFRERMISSTIFVAEDEAEVIAGTIACSVHADHEGHLRGMAVLPQYHGSPLASLLLETAEAELKRSGCTFVTLDTTAPLQRAIRFYEKHGYKASKRVTDFFGMPLYEYVKQLI